MKKLLVFILILCGFNASAQQGLSADRVEARKAFKLVNYWFYGVKRDSIAFATDSLHIPTPKAIAQYVASQLATIPGGSVPTFQQVANATPSGNITGATFQLAASGTLNFEVTTGGYLQRIGLSNSQAFLQMAGSTQSGCIRTLNSQTQAFYTEGTGRYAFMELTDPYGVFRSNWASAAQYNELRVYNNNTYGAFRVYTDSGSYYFPRTTPTSNQILVANGSGGLNWGAYPAYTASQGLTLTGTNFTLGGNYTSDINITSPSPSGNAFNVTSNSSGSAYNKLYVGSSAASGLMAVGTGYSNTYTLSQFNHLLSAVGTGENSAFTLAKNQITIATTSNVSGTIQNQLFLNNAAVYGFRYSGDVGSYNFPRATPSTGDVLISTSGSTLGWSNLTTTYIPIAGATTITGAKQFSAAVGIGGSAAASAMLDIASTTKGFLMPRMTNGQLTSISSPATGLLVYDTDQDKFAFKKGTSGWKNLAEIDDITILSVNTTGTETITGSSVNPTIIVDAGLFTPSITNSPLPANINSLSTSNMIWQRVGNSVTVSGSITVNSNSGGSIDVELTIPTASISDCYGTANDRFNNIATSVGAGSSTIMIRTQIPSSSSYEYTYTATYRL